MSASEELEYLPQLPRDPSIGIGCIGSGFIMADCQLVAYRAGGLNPVAIASRRYEQAKEVARRHSIDKRVQDLSGDALRPARVEVVDIAVPPDCKSALSAKLSSTRTFEVSWPKSRWRETMPTRRRSLTFATKPTSRCASTRTCDTTNRFGPANPYSIAVT